MYDNLDGIANRKAHPLFEEPEVLTIFKKNDIEGLDFNSLETNLRRSLKEVYIPLSTKYFYHNTCIGN